MILVRILVGLMIGIAVRVWMIAAAGAGGTGSPPPAGDESDHSTDPDLADAAAAEIGTEPGLTEAAPDTARGRAPLFLRLGMAALPVVGALGLVGSLVAILAGSVGWDLPGIGRIEGDWPLGVLLLSVATLAVWVLWQVPRWQAASWRQGTTLGDREIFDIENSARGTLGQILSGVAVLAGLIFAWQQLGNTSQTLSVSQEGQITDRFSRAVTQLGDPDLTIRLGGIYALERISRDSERDHETVLEILAAFARQRSATDQSPLAAASPVGGSQALPESLRGLPLDIDVVLKVISRRDATRDGPDCINLSGINLSSGSLTGYDLSNVCLGEANLTGAILLGADLAGVDLNGADFTSANLDGADLSGAQLTNAIFTGADLLGANFTGAVVSGANFTDARNFTAEQANSAFITDQTTILPVGISATPEF